jgi:glycosyltransferase involved in cell wall biosynthesis
MKITVGMICFNSMPFVEGALSCVLPYASQIFVVEGPVGYWQRRGHTESTDGTIQAIEQLAKEHDSITFLRGQWGEKDEQHNAYVDLVDADYLWVVDPDELYTQADIELILGLLETRQPDAAIIPWLDFVGGFERAVNSDRTGRVRFLRWQPGSQFVTTRPPELSTCRNVLGDGKLLTSKELARLGVRMRHYSHVFPHQVEARAEYYEHFGIPCDFRRLTQAAKPFSGEHPAWTRRNAVRLLKEYG